MSVNLTNIHKAHFTGVGGIGMSAILRLFASRGISVSGSDLVHLPPKETLPAGTYYEGSKGERVPDGVDVLIYSYAVPETDPERIAVKARGVPELCYPEALALVTREYNTVAVSGTHGKSTVTALLGKLFEAGQFDPSVIVGAEVPGWDHNLRIGASNMFVVEACEYRRHMLHLSPQAIVLTNLELDHPDYYVDLADVKDAFREYITKLSGDGLLIVNNDDANLRDVTKNSDTIKVSYGVGEGADLVARNIKQSGNLQTFEMTWKGTPLGAFSTPLPGVYNIYNILAASAAYLAYGGKSELIQSVLDTFIGVGRRFEVVGSLGNTTIISDYAHHPTALRVLVEATRERYQGKKILTIFRPHHRERTIKLLNQFVETISGIPHTILVEIYDVPGREEGIAISSKDVIQKVLERSPNTDVVYAADLDDAERIARQKSHEFDVILVVGAGDADQLAHKLAH